MGFIFKMHMLVNENANGFALAFTFRLLDNELKNMV